MNLFLPYFSNTNFVHVVFADLQIRLEILCFHLLQRETILCTPIVKLNLFNAKPTKRSNTLKQWPTNCLRVFDNFVGLALKWLNKNITEMVES